MTRRRSLTALARFRSSDFPQPPEHEGLRDAEVITFFTADGMVQLPGRTLKMPQRRLPPRAPLPTWQEQGLCVASTFVIAATNGFDPKRRINVLGFCRCTDMLSEVIEDTVLQRGGEIMLRECEPRSSLHETLKMTVAIPLLWGVPPEHETLSNAIVSGGGIVEKVWLQWHFS
ncbi:hypothetical protein WJX72_011570 [[Myrmecia] bisecta]|uniref:DUF7811 domain-containing protein n=1 Tax=[Myrmecia] bisecta TaxID=41462 RepID=A0AAW1Q3Z4_9CHLO